MTGWIIAGILLAALLVVSTVAWMLGSAYEDARITADIRGEEIVTWRRKHQALRDSMLSVLDHD